MAAHRHGRGRPCYRRFVSGNLGIHVYVNFMQKPLEKANKGTASVRRVTSVDVAREVGVSRPTVSAVFGAKTGTGVSAKLRKKILETAREMGYRTNTAARATRSGRFNAVGLLLSASSSYSYLPSPLLNGLQDYLAEHKMLLTMSRLPDKSLTDDTYVPQIMREWAVDGFLVNYNHHIPPHLIELLEQHHVTSVWINAIRKHDTVLPDDLEAARRLTRHILELGHRRILYLRFGGVSHYSQEERFEGYRQVMREAGLEPRPLTVDDREIVMSDFDDSYFRASLLAMSRLDGCTAVIAESAQISQTFMHACVAKGWEVPKQLSIATFHDAPATACGVPVDCVFLEQRDVAKEAVRMLMRKIKDPGSETRSVRIPYKEISKGATLCEKV